MRAGVDTDAVRSWFYDCDAFLAAAKSHGSGAYLCACFIVSLAGHGVNGFTLALLFPRIDSAHQAAALEVFTQCIAKGGLQ